MPVQFDWVERPGQSARQLAAGTVMAALVLAACEGLARIGAPILADHEPERAGPVDTWLARDPELGWENGTGFRGSAASGYRDFPTVDSLVRYAAAHRGRQKTVLFIGGSNTYGLDVKPAEAFPAVVDSLLDNAAALNLGVPGYSSYQGLLLLRETIGRLQPDIVVASFGYNDRRYVLGPDSVDGAEWFAEMTESSTRPSRRLVDVLDWSYLFRAYRWVLQRVGLVPGPPGSVPITSLAPRVDSGSFRRNLEAMARLSRATGARFVLLALKENPAFTRGIGVGVSLLDQGKLDSAAVLFRHASEQAEDLGPLGSWYLAQAEALRSDSGAAASVRTEVTWPMPADGGDIIRPADAYLTIMRDVADRMSVDLVDATSILEQSAVMFLDESHLTPLGHHAVGELIASHLAREIMGPGTPSEPRGDRATGRGMGRPR